ncbi:MAG: Spx/MgsR family RNA polymerase-binding regulatory protein [Alphaproteobacteria bacterium]|nr:Spx/MgsR family RNA polymerase-binding regulatory protein [Alphaproteobacteria bacterium]
MKVYGIKNCDTVRKCISFLEFNNIEYDFIDLKKNEISEQDINLWVNTLGWDIVINKKSQSWRSLPQQVKDNASNDFLNIIQSNKSIIKRPLIIYNNQEITVGFNSKIQDKIKNG